MCLPQAYAFTPGQIPFDMPAVEQPRIPAYTVSITQFGGVADGATLNTEAFGKAMKHLAEKGGGKLVVPAGIWLTGPIQFENNTELHVEQGALVLFLPILMPIRKSAPSMRAIPRAVAWLLSGLTRSTM